MPELPNGLYHVMMWNYRDEVSAEDRAFHESELMKLPQRVPSLLSVQRGPVISGRNQTFSHCFVMLFASRDGLREYATHPNHLKFSTPFREACAVQVVVDFEARE